MINFLFQSHKILSNVIAGFPAKKLITRLRCLTRNSRMLEQSRFYSTFTIITRAWNIRGTYLQLTFKRLATIRICTGTHKGATHGNGRSLWTWSVKELYIFHTCISSPENTKLEPQDLAAASSYVLLCACSSCRIHWDLLFRIIKLVGLNSIIVYLFNWLTYTEWLIDCL